GAIITKNPLREKRLPGAEGEHRSWTQLSLISSGSSIGAAELELIASGTTVQAIYITAVVSYSTYSTRRWERILPGGD
ncbi:MAG: hypothetical protein WA716_05290, partial [Pseudolabrys sp.]